MNFQEYEAAIHECVQTSTQFPGGKAGRVDINSMTGAHGIGNKNVKTVVIFPGANNEAQFSVSRFTAEIVRRDGQVGAIEVYASPVPRMLIFGKLDDLKFILDVDLSFPADENYGEDIIRSLEEDTATNRLK